MKTMWLAMMAWLATVVTPAQAASATKATLLLPVEVARPGDEIVVGVELAMGPGWHTYWVNSGDSGDATRIEWTLPAGVTAGEIRWPVPEKLLEEGLTTYIYHGRVVLLVPLKLAPTLPVGPIDLKASVSWLECEKQCLPGSGTVTGRLTIGADPKPSSSAATLAAAAARLPKPCSGLQPDARWAGPAAGKERVMVLQWSVPGPVTDPDFFPYRSDDFQMAGETEWGPEAAGKVTLRKRFTSETGAWPSTVKGLAVFKTSGTDMLDGHEVTFEVREGGLAGAGGSKGALLPMLGLAFLGGLILNVMPCVLPVIALKILGFVSQSGSEPGRVRQLGLVYTLGVLFSFALLAGAVIGVQQAGRLASWGMQFQNPQFLVGLMVLVTLVAMNLFGVFEVNLGGAAMDAAGTLSAREGSAGAFFNGVLATVLATPCTAPFLGVALGFAFAQPPLIVMVMFLTVGLGLASPYLILTWQPAWLRILPKPGVWMEHFKVAMGFPMLATAAWMFSLALGRFGEDSAFWLGLFLVLVALVGWIWGQFVQRGRKRQGLAMTVCAVVLAGAYFGVLERELQWRKPPPPQVNSGQGVQMHGGIAWRPWSREAVDAARSAGRPVLVDFTAKWCPTCQLNKRTSLEIDPVREKLKALNFETFRADNTFFPPAIAEELRHYGRAGVPMVLVFPADSSRPAEVLPELLRPGIVLEALDRAVRSPAVSQAR